MRFLSESYREYSRLRKKPREESADFWGKNLNKKIVPQCKENKEATSSKAVSHIRKKIYENASKILVSLINSLSYIDNEIFNN